MKKVFTLILACAIMLSCKSKQDKLKELALPIVRETVISDSLVYEIDSITVFKVDTLTDKKYQLRLLSTLFRKHDFYLSMVDSYNQTAKLYQSSARTMQSQAQLYGYLGSRTLVEHELRQAKEKLEDSNAELDNAKKYTDSAQIVFNRIKVINNYLKTGKLDSVTFKGYVAWFKVKGSDKKNQEVKLDSMFVYLNESMKIIPVK